MNVSCRMFLLGMAFSASAARADDWPMFRGPGGMGHSPSKGLPTIWGGPNDAGVLWKAPLLASDDKARFDQNQSSPIVAGGRVYVALSYWPSASTTKEHPAHRLIAFDSGDGKRLWETPIAPGPWLLTDLRGGYTAPTPAADAERVYVLFGSAVVAAVDRGGKVAWRREIVPHAFDVAIGTSPVLYRDTLFVLCDMRTGSRLLAFDAATGEPRWSRDRKGNDWAHSTPAIATVAGKEQLLVAGAHAVQGLDPSTGESIWFASLPDKPSTRIGDAPSPVYGAGVVYVDSGRGGPGLAVDPTGAGDVTKSHVRWVAPSVSGNSLGSPVIVGEYLYRLQSPGVLKCFKLPAGELVYSERLQDSVPASSPVATSDGRIYFATAGKSYVVRAGPTFELLGASNLGDASFASPAVADGRLYLRGPTHLYCVGARR